MNLGVEWKTAGIIQDLCGTGSPVKRAGRCHERLPLTPPPKRCCQQDLHGVVKCKLWGASTMIIRTKKNGKKWPRVAGQTKKNGKKSLEVSGRIKKNCKKWLKVAGSNHEKRQTSTLLALVQLLLIQPLLLHSESFCLLLFRRPFRKVPNQNATSCIQPRSTSELQPLEFLVLGAPFRGPLYTQHETR